MNAVPTSKFSWRSAGIVFADDRYDLGVAEATLAREWISFVARLCGDPQLRTAPVRVASDPVKIAWGYECVRRKSCFALRRSAHRKPAGDIK